MLPYLLDVLTRMAIFGTLTLGLNIAFGYTGIVHLGYVAFAGIGAYAYVIATVRFGWLPVAALALALGVTAGAAGLLARLVKKITGDQLALVTLFFALVVYIVLLSWRDIFGVPPISRLLPPAWHDVTRGSLGIVGIRRPPGLAGPAAFFLASLGVVGLSYRLVQGLGRSPFGRVMAAVRDDERAAETLGKNAAAVKSKVFILSSLLAAVGGILLAGYSRFIDPGSYYLNDLVLVLTALIIGGLGSARGSLLGVLVIFALTEPLRFIPPAVLGPGLLGPMRQIIYAAALLAILLGKPKGLLGKIELT